MDQKEPPGATILPACNAPGTQYLRAYRRCKMDQSKDNAISSTVPVKLPSCAAIPSLLAHMCRRVPFDRTIPSDARACDPFAPVHARKRWPAEHGDPPHTAVLLIAEG